MRFKLRGSLVPATGFASQAWFPIFLFGILLGATNLALSGVALFAAIVLFQLVTAAALLPLAFELLFRRPLRRADLR